MQARRVDNIRIENALECGISIASNQLATSSQISILNFQFSIASAFPDSK
jgi:hypothetical protein